MEPLTLDRRYPQEWGVSVDGAPHKTVTVFRCYRLHLTAWGDGSLHRWCECPEMPDVVNEVEIESCQTLTSAWGAEWHRLLTQDTLGGYAPSWTDVRPQAT
jgi:hypothetical protein